MPNTPRGSLRDIDVAVTVARLLPVAVCNDLAVEDAGRDPDPFCASSLEKVAEAMDNLVRTISNG